VCILKKHHRNICSYKENHQIALGHAFGALQILFEEKSSEAFTPEDLLLVEQNSALLAAWARRARVEENGV